MYALPVDCRARPSANGAAAGAAETPSPSSTGAAATAQAAATGGSKRPSRGAGGPQAPADGRASNGSTGNTLAGVAGSTGAPRPVLSVPGNTANLPLAAALQALVAWQKHSMGQGSGTNGASNGPAPATACPAGPVFLATGGGTTPASEAPLAAAAGFATQHQPVHQAQAVEGRAVPPAPPPAIPMMHTPGNMRVPKFNPSPGGAVGAAAAAAVPSILPGGGGLAPAGLTPAQITAAAAAAIALLVKKQQHGQGQGQGQQQ
jgi:hypothetical protein